VEKLIDSQLYVLHGSKNIRKYGKEKNYKQKAILFRRQGPCIGTQSMMGDSRGVSRDGGIESMMGRIGETVGFKEGSERTREL